MLGLMYKDFLVMKKEIITNLILMIIYTVPVCLPWSKMMGEVPGSSEGLFSGVGLSYFVMPITTYFFIFMIIGGLQSNLFAHDEKNVYSSWAVSSPMTVKGQVLSKYYMSLLFGFVGLVLAYVVDIVASFTNGVVGSTVGVAMVMFFIQMFVASFDLPFIIRFGSKNGSMFKVIMMSVICFAAIVYGLFGPLPEGDFGDFMWSKLEWLVYGDKGVVAIGFLALAPVAIALLYYLSYKVSVRLYMKGVENYEH
ncbi:MAG: ABC-2 transporter permease [Lachnospira sp.]|nr:ABC-2 transporter permease [Lachnospira sp.]